MKRTPFSALSQLAFGILVTAALSSPADAVVVVNSFKNIAPLIDPHPVHQVHNPATDGAPNLMNASSSDLAHGLTATVTYINGTGNPSVEEAGGVARWTDGSISTVYNLTGGDGNAIDHAAYGVVHASPTGINTFVTFDLGALYNLSQVDVFLGWPDSGRDDASFIVKASTDGINYANLITYTKPTPDNTAPGTPDYSTTPVTNLHSITESGEEYLAPFIQYVQLQFIDADNGYAGLVEVDIYGETPTFHIADVNRDGEVDINDFYVISDNFLKVPSALGMDGDIVADNIINAADFRLWKNSVSPALLAQVNGAVVPEPATVVTLAMIAALGLAMRRRRDA